MGSKRIFLAVIVSTVVACSGSTGPQGPVGPGGANAPATGTITGNVKDAVALTALAGVTVTVSDTGGTQLATPVTTDQNGDYTVTAPIGTVVVTFAKQYFTSPGNLLVGVVGGQSVTANASMSEASSGKPAISAVTATRTDVGYGATTTVNATASDPNGDTLTYAWSNATVPALGTVTGNGNQATVVLPSMTDAFAYRLESPTAPNQYIAGYVLPDRFGIVPILPDTRGEMSVSVTVTDGRGQSASTSVTVDAASVLTSARNVAIGTKVYLNSGHAGTAAWALTPPTSGSTAALSDPTARTPYFVADVAGTYTVTEGTNTMTIYAGDWKGVITGGSGTSIVVDTNCTMCHGTSGIAPDQFTPWMATGHATMMTRGLGGANSTHYGSSCLVCHTVGNDGGVVNNGFDDVAAAAGWTFPATYSSTNWTNMVASYPTVARLANIQCENCHGPQNSTAHMATGTTGDFQSPRIGYSAELCATCHASGTGHHNYSEWASVDKTSGMGHSNRTDAMGIGTRGGTLNSHCGRCHAAQGYTVYATQLAAGNPGTIPSGSPVLTQVTTANVESVTCTACHDPHSVANPSQLRFYGDTPLLAAGFQMFGVGKGAQCMTCHNSRNATLTGGGTYLHEDGAQNPTSYAAPHQACQTDVFGGRNAYFLGSSTPMTSKHAAVADTCVGCHMTNNPETHLSHGSPAVSTHAFRITDANRSTLCANCHSTSVDGEAIAAGVEASLANLGATISNAVKAKMNGAGLVTVTAYDAASDAYSAATQVNTATNAVTAVSMVEIHGQIGFNVTFANPVNLTFNGTAKSMSTFGVQLGSIQDAAGANALYALSGNLVRAGWNYFLVEGDQSKGIHNPTFVNTVLNTTMAQNLTN
ncbi:MAG TPA: hypothetical protein VF841_01870 [Anaeromyxobacter sp.]